MNDESYRVLCEPILSHLKVIESIVSAESNKTIFDIDENAKTKDGFDELTRICRSLEQYMARSGALAYVGFLGHFSAGKSCTINTLIEEKTVNRERTTVSRNFNDSDPLEVQWKFSV